MHEYMHFVLRARKSLPKLLGKEAQQFFAGKAPFYEDDLGGFFEEAITRIFADVYISGEDPQSTIDYYEDLKKQGIHTYGEKTIPVWQATITLKPIVDEYFAGRLNEEETRQQLFQASKDFIVNY